MNANPPRNPAFTLIEMLVVVAILGVLLALLLPAVSRARASARATVCRNQLRQMSVELAMYAHDQKGRYPHYLGPAGPSFGDAAGAGGRAQGLVYWSSKLIPYGGTCWTNRSLHCPGYREAVQEPHEKGSVERLGGYAYNTKGVRAEKMNGGLWGLGPILFWQAVPGVDAPPVTESQIVTPAEFLAAGDSQCKVGERGGSDVWGCIKLYGSSLEEAPYLNRHGVRDNQAHVDGHVGSMDPRDLYNPIRSAALWNRDHQPHAELWAP